MKNLYTIFLGDQLWENVIDDMNTTEDWSIGGMVWTDRKKAIACIRNLKKYDFETEQKKFHVVQILVNKINLNEKI